MSRHTLVIAQPVDDDQDVSIVCDEPAQCVGWQECRKHHGNARWDASDGPEDCDERAPWADREEFTFHGEAHEWRSGWGWTTAYPGCIVDHAVFERGELPDKLTYQDDEGCTMLHAGSYPVEPEWFDETTCLLELVDQ